MVVVGICARILACIVVGLAVQGCFTPQPAPPRLPAFPANGGSVTGIASWYGPGFNGRRTSSGASYNQDDLTAASTIFPLGTRLLVTNLTNGRSVRVLVNDHGPFIDGRVLDLSYRAALALGIVKPGTARVQMEVLSTPPGGPPLGPRYFVQVGSFSDLANAQQVGAQLGRYYNDVHIVEVTFEANRYYRVRMGMFADRASAERRAQTIPNIGVRPIIISE